MDIQQAANDYKAARAALKDALNQDTTPGELDAALDAYNTAMATANANLIKSATIESLSCNQTTAGDPPHTHNVSTVEATGKIK